MSTTKKQLNLLRKNNQKKQKHNTAIAVQHPINQIDKKQINKPNMSQRLDHKDQNIQQKQNIKGTNEVKNKITNQKENSNKTQNTVEKKKQQSKHEQKQSKLINKIAQLDQQKKEQIKQKKKHAVQVHKQQKIQIKSQNESKPKQILKQITGQESKSIMFQQPAQNKKNTNVVQKHNLNSSKLVQNFQLAMNAKQQTSDKSPTKSSKSIKKSQNKLKLNQSRVQDQLKLKSALMTSQQIQNSIKFSKKENQRLKQYFKHICQRIYSYPKNATFDSVKSLFTTINLTEWMIFCKEMKITDKFKALDDGIKLLSSIYKKYEDIQRRLDFNGFSMAVKQIIIQFTQNNSINIQGSKQQTKEQKLKNITEFLCINTRKNHIERLKSMRVMCSMDTYTMSKSRSNTHRQNKQNNTPQNQLKNQRSSVQQSSNTQNNSIYISNNNVKSPLRKTKIQVPKIYKSNFERKQSQLMHKLAVSNLNKVDASLQIKNSFGKFSDNDDKFLKQYFNKQQKVKNGVIKRLQKSTKTKSKY